MSLKWRTQMYIDGQWTSAAGGRTLPVVNPANGERLAEVALADAADVDRAVRAACQAFDEGPWPRLEPLERGRRLYKLALLMRERLDDLALTDTLNIGKPIVDSRGWDAPVSAELFESYAGLADKISGRSFGTLPESIIFHIREPIGVVAAVIPWNFPITNAAIKVAPVLACGNCIVLKPSELAPLSALMLAEIAHEAGIPPGVLNVINGLGPDAGKALLEHPGIDKITMTGRLQTGQQVMQAAIAGVKGVCLELGGKTPSLVFADAPLDRAVDGVMRGIFIHCGQVCVAGSRLLIHRDIHDEFLDRLLTQTRKLRMGDPTDEGNQLGCIATPTLRESIERYVSQARGEGASLVLGGKRPDDPALSKGCYYVPTVFDQVMPEMTIAREEVFGPVLSVLTFKDEAEAVRIANDTDFGLMANVWTNDGQRALHMARRLCVGKVAINGGGAFRAGSPMTGFRMSGIGSDLGYDETIHEYTRCKTVLYSLMTEHSPWVQ